MATSEAAGTATVVANNGTLWSLSLSFVVDHGDACGETSCRLESLFGGGGSSKI